MKRTAMKITMESWIKLEKRLIKLLDLNQLDHLTLDIHTILPIPKRYTEVSRRTSQSKFKKREQESTTDESAEEYLLDNSNEKRLLEFTVLRKRKMSETPLYEFFTFFWPYVRPAFAIMVLPFMGFEARSQHQWNGQVTSLHQESGHHHEEESLRWNLSGNGFPILNPFRNRSWHVKYVGRTGLTSLTYLPHREDRITSHVDPKPIKTGGISCLPEAIQFLLHCYPTPNVIRGAVNALQNIRQKSTEDETE